MNAVVRQVRPDLSDSGNAARPSSNAATCDRAEMNDEIDGLTEIAESAKYLTTDAMT